jgi:hypothetical protein
MKIVGERFKKITSAMLLIIIALFATESSGGNENKNVTPFGSYCKQMSHYGMHRTLIDTSEAEKALKHIYGKKGLAIKIIGNEGRFLKVEIKNGNEPVDIIIFDRRTGRIRSIY